MQIKRVGKRSWQIDGMITSCRTSVKSFVQRDYLARNRINPTTFNSLPLKEFKKHVMTIKALWKQLGLE